jgi:Brp/Blh family beta-carotene 15,15'-monooxygenase
MSYLSRRPALAFAAVALLLLLALLALRVLEARWPPLAWWAFVLLSLTLGFGHGALDALLLLGQFKPVGKALLVSAAYLACVLVAGWVLSWSVPFALLALVLMSVWHFGELHRASTWARICVGGASVMWPMLVARDTMAQLLQDALGPGVDTVWLAWHLLANGWLALVIATALGWLVRRFAMRKNLITGSQGLTSGAHGTALWAAIEIAVVLCAFLILSPLLAFALYFGLYHCLAHVARVRRALAAYSGRVFLWYGAAFVASALATATLLLLLWRFLPPVTWLDGANHARAIQWLVVSLAAVTLPHLLLVSYSARWLGR